MQQQIKETALKNIEGSPLILDIRSNQDYNNLQLKQPHLHIPAANLDIPSFLKTTPIKAHQHLYLLSQKGDASRLVAKRFLKSGFQNIINITSVGISILTVLYLSVAREPYAIIVAFLLFAVKVLLFLKR